MAVSVTINGVTYQQPTTGDSGWGDAQAQVIQALAGGTVQDSDYTTKGDILVRSATGPTRIGVGTDGKIIEADSTQTTGIKWNDIRKYLYYSTPTSLPNSKHDMTVVCEFTGTGAVSLPQAADNLGLEITFIKLFSGPDTLDIVASLPDEISYAGYGPSAQLYLNTLYSSATLYAAKVGFWIAQVHD